MFDLAVFGIHKIEIEFFLCYQLAEILKKKKIKKKKMELLSQISQGKKKKLSLPNRIHTSSTLIGSRSRENVKTDGSIF